MAGDMKALAELRERVTPGTRVHTINHDYRNDSGTCVVKRVSDNVYGSGRSGYIAQLDKPRKNQGRTFTTSYYLWPQEGDDFEVDGDELRVYNPSHAYVGGRRAITATFKFEIGEG